jgi:hypothetical protein
MSAVAPDPYTLTNHLTFENGGHLRNVLIEDGIPLYVTNTTISDANGNLLFYSNGLQVANADFEVVENSDSLAVGSIADLFKDEGFSATMGMIALPTTTDSVFYIIQITLDAIPFIGTLVKNTVYAKVDMRLNQGMGKVLEKRVEILSGSSLRELTACQHGNGSDWWVMVAESKSNTYRRSLLTDQGFTQVDSQQIGYRPDPEDFPEGGGQNLFSPDGKYYIDFDSWNGLRVFDFDRCTGLLSNPRQVNFNERWSFGAGAAVSPNSQYLYVSSSNRIVQYDLLAADLGASADTVAYRQAGVPGYSQMNLMRDGRIYILPFSTTRTGHFIRYPNRKGSACEVVQGGLTFDSWNNVTIPHYPNYRLGTEPGSACDTLGLGRGPLADWHWDVSESDLKTVIFTDNSWYRPATWLWDFGDGSTSQDTNAVHTYALPGMYEVCLTVCNALSCDSFCHTIEVMTSSVANPQATAGALRVFPNPATDRVQISFTQFKAGMQIAVTDLLGNRLLQQTVTAEDVALIDVSTLASGIYLVQLIENGQLLGVAKCVVFRE